MLNIKFNNICLANKIVPNCVNVTVNNMSSATQHTKRKVEIMWIREEIQCLYSKKQELNTELYQLHLELSNHVKYQLFFEELTHKVRTYTGAIIEKKQKTEEKKLPKMLNQKASNTTEHH